MYRSLHIFKQILFAITGLHKYTMAAEITYSYFCVLLEFATIHVSHELLQILNIKHLNTYSKNQIC